ncbi:MAG: peptidoglycan-binding protein [Candidatus Sungbacteria bacterium]|nr:peptidoglycan-binding protein [Candidatus Sungbacteria bacterium]
MFIGAVSAPVVFAETSSDSPESSQARIIQQLQKQVQLLQQQVTALQAELGKQPEETTPTALQPEPAPPELTRSLSRGSSGDDVRTLQEFLAHDKDVYPEGLLTGYFGPASEAAVKRWQKKHGVEPRGIVGPKTIAKFQELGRGVVQGLTAQGAGSSGIIPPGLLTAPGIQKRFDTAPSANPSTATPSGTIPAQPIGQTATTTIPAVPVVSATTTITATTTVATTSPGTISATPASGAGSPPPPPSGTTPPPPPSPSPSPTPTPPAPEPTPVPSPSPAPPAADTAPPSTPMGFTATAASSTQINLAWVASNDNVGVVGYKIYRGGVQIAITTSGILYSDTGLVGATAYSYAIAAYDAAGNVSAQSNSVQISTFPPPAPALPAPSFSTTGAWNFSQAPADYGKAGQVISFTYSKDQTYYSNTFRLYRKQPGENTFSRVAEFTGLASTACFIGNSPTVISGEWSMIKGGCDYFINRQVGSSKFFSDFILGEYQFYVAAVNDSGIEGTPSQVGKSTLYSLTIESPTALQSPTSPTPTFTWSSHGWPCCSQGYYITVSDNLSAASPFWSSSVLIGTNGGSKVYDGPPLDPAKKYSVFIYGYTSGSNAQYGAFSTAVPQFWIVAPTTSNNNSDAVLRLVQITASSTPPLSESPRQKSRGYWSNSERDTRETSQTASGIVTRNILNFRHSFWSQ